MTAELGYHRLTYVIYNSWARLYRRRLTCVIDDGLAPVVVCNGLTYNGLVPAIID
jgi:hypothetical protein